MIEKIKLWHRAFKYRWKDDRAEIAYLLKNISKGDTVFDIGAHKGGYTYWMQRAVCHNGKVIAFEPQEKGAALLKQLFPAITVEPLAVSSTSGEQELHIQPQSYDVSFEASLQNKYPGSQKELVVTTTIDDYCSMHSLSPSFIKIDVEGHELDVLKGGRNTLRSVHPHLLVEVEKRHVGEEGMKELFALMKSLGYSGSFSHNGLILPVEDFRAELHQREEQVAKRGLYSNNFMFD